MCDCEPARPRAFDLHFAPSTYIPLQNRIVGGVQTDVNEYPMMAGLVQQSTPSVYCGATIISRNYAITAAHCVDPPVDQLGLLVGDQDYRISKRARNDVDL